MNYNDFSLFKCVESKNRTEHLTHKKNMPKKLKRINSIYGIKDTDIYLYNGIIWIRC